mgnify:CR=1 FL=1
MQNRYEKIAENGMNKKVTEPYLVDALSSPKLNRVLSKKSLRSSAENSLYPTSTRQLQRALPQRRGSCRPLVQVQALLHHPRREKRCGKENSNQRTGTGCRPARCREETGRRHEGYNGRLRHRIGCRNCTDGRIPLLCRT